MGFPVRRTTGNLADEAPQNLGTLEAVGHFGVKLQSIESARLIGHRRERRVVARPDDLESRGYRDNTVAVTHPYVEHPAPLGVAIVFEAVEQPRVGGRPNLRGAELAMTGQFDLAAQLRGHGLHSIANTEDRNARREYFRVRLGTFDVIYRFGTAGKNDRLRRKAPDLLRIDIAR